MKIKVIVKCCFALIFIMTVYCTYNYFKEQTLIDKIVNENLININKAKYSDELYSKNMKLEKEIKEEKKKNTNVSESQIMKIFVNKLNEANIKDIKNFFTLKDPNDTKFQDNYIENQPLENQARWDNVLDNLKHYQSLRVKEIDSSYSVKDDNKDQIIGFYTIKLNYEEEKKESNDLSALVKVEIDKQTYKINNVVSVKLT